jgi:hypothetical protein
VTRGFLVEMILGFLLEAVRTHCPPVAGYAAQVTAKLLRSAGFAIRRRDRGFRAGLPALAASQTHNSFARTLSGLQIGATSLTIMRP